MKQLMHDCKYDIRVFVRALHLDARGVRKQKAKDGTPIYYDVRGNHHKVGFFKRFCNGVVSC